MKTIINGQLVEIVIGDYHESDLYRTLNKKKK